MDLLGSIIGKMDSGPPRPKPTAAQLRARKMQEAQQKEEEKRREHYSNKIKRKMETIRKYVDEEQKRLAESEDPEVCERIEPLIKYNFHPMDAVWRKIVADIAEEFDLVAVALGPRDARYNCICNRHPTNVELRDMRGIAANCQQPADNKKANSESISLSQEISLYAQQREKEAAIENSEEPPGWSSSSESSQSQSSSGSHFSSSGSQSSSRSSQSTQELPDQDSSPRKIGHTAKSRIKPGAKFSSYSAKISNIVGRDLEAKKIASEGRSFGLVSASLKRDHRTIEETQREMMRIKKSKN